MRKTLPEFNYLWSLFRYSNGKLYWKIKVNKMSRNSPDEEVGTIHKSGYLAVGINGETYQVHRIVWKMFTGKDPLYDIDHINHKRYDNRMSNLRETSENQKNTSKYKNNTTGYIGVYRHRDKYKVIIQGTYYGLYSSIGEAILKSKELYEKLGFHNNHGL